MIFFINLEVKKMFDKLLDSWARMVHDKKWWKFFLGAITNIRIYPGGLVLWGPSSYKMKGPNMREVLDVIQPGDVLLRVYRHYVGSMFTPGYWTHAALYVGEWQDKPNRVIHMLGHGVCNEDLLTFLRTDGVAVLRCKNKDLIAPAIDKAKEYLNLGTDYDFGFIRGDTSLYCSEMIFFCFGKPEEIKFDRYILPDDLACDLFDYVYKRKHNHKDD